MTNIFREKSAQEEDADLQRKIDAIRKEIKGDTDNETDEDLKRKIDEIRKSIKYRPEKTTKKDA